MMEPARGRGMSTAETCYLNAAAVQEFLSGLTSLIMFTLFLNDHYILGYRETEGVCVCVCVCVCVLATRAEYLVIIL